MKLRKQSKNTGFTITIGERGLIFIFYKHGEIKNKIFLHKLNQEAKNELKNIFLKNKSAPIYILLDNVDQSYKKKEFPPVKKHDLIHLANRDIASDPDKESLKNYIIFDNPKEKLKRQKDKKWECLFVSSSLSKSAQEFIDFATEMPNRLVGIYMLPIESQLLFELLKENILSSSKISNKKSDVYCLVSQNKASGLRQTVISHDRTIFTRLLDYNSDDNNFSEKYEKDLISTFEYLKRLFPDLNSSEIEIINIFSNEILQKISTIKNMDFNFINFTPYKVASIVGKNDLIPEDGKNCDLLIAKIFFDSRKKILKFLNTKIAILEKYFLITKISYYANLAILTFIAFYCLFAIDKIENLKEETNLSSAQKSIASQNFSKTTDLVLDGEVFDDSSPNNKIEIDKILDLGKIHEFLSPLEKNYLESYVNLNFIKKYQIKIDNFSFDLKNFDDKNPQQNSKYKLSLRGKIYNKSGDIEDLFNNFDKFISTLKNNFPEERITYSDLPKNIDFSKKYYEFPIDFTIEKN